MKKGGVLNMAIDPNHDPDSDTTNSTSGPANTSIPNTQPPKEEIYNENDLTGAQRDIDDEIQRMVFR